MSSEGPLGFDDETDEEREARWARRRDPDLDQPAGSPDTPVSSIPVPRPAGYSRYGWFVGVVAVLVMGYIGVNTLRTKGVSSTGLARGTRAPAFAAPLVQSDVPGDVNVATKGRLGHGRGDQPACSIRRPDVLNICRLYASGPVVLVFAASKGGECIHELDVVERVRGRFPQVRFAAVAIRGKRGDMAALARRHLWAFPIGYDHDGALATLYGVAVCPQITYLRQGGRVQNTSIGLIGEAELARRVRLLVAHG